MIDRKYGERERAHIASERAEGKTDLDITSQMLAGWALAFAQSPIVDLPFHESVPTLLRDATYVMGILADLGWTHPEMTLEGSDE